MSGGWAEAGTLEAGTLEAGTLEAGAPENSVSSEETGSDADAGDEEEAVQKAAQSVEGPCYPGLAPAAPWLDRMQGGLYKAVCDAGQWFDAYFGDEDLESEEGPRGRLSIGARWNEKDGFRDRIRFRARIPLPRLERRVDAFIGRVEVDDFVQETENQLETLPEAFSSADEEVLLGLGYKPIKSLRDDVDFSVGVKVRSPLDPYVKGSYKTFRLFGEKRLIRFKETIFWQDSEGWGSTTRLDWERIWDRGFLLRISNVGTVSDRAEGLRWNSWVTLYHRLSPRQALAYQLHYFAETDAAVPVSEYGGRMIYRRNMFRDWLFGEVQAGVIWPRDEPEETREAALLLGFAVEIKFGGEWGPFGDGN
ncbi:MAG: hypothetical protein AAGD01_16205 [Acidobacteriota bacterium]